MEQPIHHRIEQHAASQPDRIAIRYREQALTYRELNRQANRLARLLLVRGLPREGRVAVCLEPGLEVPVALLAIHKAGGAYLPLDPTYPKARIRAIIEDAQPHLILTRRMIVARLGLQADS